MRDAQALKSERDENGGFGSRWIDDVRNLVVEVLAAREVRTFWGDLNTFWGWWPGTHFSRGFDWLPS